MAKTRRSPQQWQQLIDEQAHSGLTISEYCMEHKLTVSSFYLWRKKLSSLGKEAPPIADWLSLTPSQSLASEQEWQLELTLPGGVVLRMNAPT